MGSARQYCVYIMTNHSGTLHVGVTNDLSRRAAEHKAKIGSAFTKRYRMGRLLYFEQTSDVRSALERERQIKGWRRYRKLALIKERNPRWIDLARSLDGVRAESAR
jgi:putative endonuclease